MRRLLCLFVAASFSCSDADLYSQTGLDPLRPDRLSITGELCTEDTSGSKFPVKVLFVVDSSLDMFIADPNSDRLAGPPGSIDALIQRNRTQPHVRFGFVGSAGSSRAVPNPDGQQFWRPQDPEVSLAMAALSSPLGSARDIVAALSQVESFVLNDIANSTPGEVLRSRYLVSMLFAGPPEATNGTPIANQTEASLAAQVEATADRIYARGALEFALNVGMLYYGPRTIDRGAAGTNFNCYPSGGPMAMPCPCAGGGMGSPAYCGIFCEVQVGNISEAQNNTARDIYEAMAFAGGGLFQEFECPPNIDLSVGIAETGVQLVKKDIVAHNRNSRLTVDGPVADSDGDGLSDLEEIGAPTPTEPDNWDTDLDGIGDRLEFRAFPKQDPLDARDRPASCGPIGILVDRDIDLLNDCEEGLLQTSASIPDTDGDGLPDLLEFLGGTVPTSAEDRLLDFDGDGIQNATEVLEHTNPRTNDGALRGTEGYRYRVQPKGLRPVTSMEDPQELRGITFRTASTNVVSGQGYIRWDPCTQMLSGGDLRAGPNRPLQLPQFTPVPVFVGESGVYQLVSEFFSPMTGELIDRVTLEVFVTLEVMPACPDAPVDTFPLLSVAERNCYDVRISNIKLVETLASNGEVTAGINRVLVFFTQAPSDRLSSPGISKVAEIKVRFFCEDPNNPDSCRREPSDGLFVLTDNDFVSP